MNMTEICLKFSTLEHVMKILTEKLNTNEKHEIILIEKHNINRISNILTFIPLDVCKIINTYTFEKNTYRAYIICSTQTVYFELDGLSISMNYSNASGIIALDNFFSSAIQLYGEVKYYSISMVNAFMEHAYGKKTYIDMQDIISYDMHKIGCEQDHIEVIYNFKSNFITACYNFPDNENCFTDYRSNIAGFRINDPKLFKRHIVIAKCIFNGVIKYYKKN